MTPLLILQTRALFKNLPDAALSNNYCISNFSLFGELAKYCKKERKIHILAENVRDFSGLFQKKLKTRLYLERADNYYIILIDLREDDAYKKGRNLLISIQTVPWTNKDMLVK